MTLRERLDGPNVEHLGVFGRRRELRRLGLGADERSAIQVHDPLHVRRARRCDRSRLGDEQRHVVVRGAGLKRRSKPIVVEAFELIALPQSEPATWPG